MSTVQAHVDATHLPFVSSSVVREARHKLDNDPLNQVWSLGWQAVPLGEPSTWVRFCQGDGKKFCCSRNGCHPLCNCSL